MSDVLMSDVPMSDVPMSDVPMSDVPMSDVPMSDARIRSRLRCHHGLMIILACLSMTACQWFSKEASPHPTASLPDSGDSTSVYIAQLVQEELYEPLVLAGIVKAKRSHPLMAPLAGVVATLHASEGERVRKGQLLLSLQPDAMGLQYNNYRVLAPIAGTLTNFRLDLGHRIEANAKIGELIANTEELITEVAASHEDLATLKEGQRLTIILSPSSSQELTTTGLITHIAPAADDLTHTFAVTIAIDCSTDPCRALPRLGTMAKAIAKANLRLGYKVPTRYLHDQQTKMLTLKADNTAHWQDVKAGRNYGDHIEVTAGIEPNTRVVSSFSRRPSEGDKVSISSQKPAPDHGKIAREASTAASEG